MGFSIGFGSSKGSTKQSSSPAAWVEDASKRGVQYAEDMYKKGYSPFGGQRVASLSQNEVSAQQLAGQDRYTPFLDQASGAFGRIGQMGTADQGLTRYLNPYREQVLDSANRKLGQSYTDQMNTLRGQRASRGAFGGSRQTLLEGNLTRDYLEQQGDLYTKGMDQAFQTALEASQADLTRELQGALGQGQGFTALGGQAAGLTNDQIRALMATGEAGRSVQQGALDAQYEEFLRGMSYNQDALDRYLASLRAGDYTRTGKGSSKEQSMNFGMTG